MSKKANFNAILVKNVAGNQVVVKRKRIREKKPMVQWGDRSFPVDLSRPIYRIANRHIYMVDVEKGQLLVAASDQQIEPIMVDMIFRREIVRQLISTNNAMATNLVSILLGLIMGLLGGWILGQFIGLG